MPEWARMARVRRCDNLGNPVLAALKQIPLRASWAFRSDADDAQDGVDVEPQPVIQHFVGHQVAFEYDRAGEPVGEIVISDGAVVHRDGHGVEMVSRPRHRLGKHPASVGLDQLFLYLDQGLPDDDLLPGAGGGLADVGLGDGDVSGGISRHRQ